jgi:hypothetical protein
VGGAMEGRRIAAANSLPDVFQQTDAVLEEELRHFGKKLPIAIQLSQSGVAIKRAVTWNKNGIDLRVRCFVG